MLSVNEANRTVNLAVRTASEYIQPAEVSCNEPVAPASELCALKLCLESLENVQTDILLVNVCQHKEVSLRGRAFFFTRSSSAFTFRGHSRHSCLLRAHKPWEGGRWEIVHVALISIAVQLVDRAGAPGTRHDRLQHPAADGTRRVHQPPQRLLERHRGRLLPCTVRTVWGEREVPADSTGHTVNIVEYEPT